MQKKKKKKKIQIVPEHEKHQLSRFFVDVATKKEREKLSLVLICYVNPQLSVMVIYTPTERAPCDEKDEFYQSLATYLEQIKRHHVQLVLGDFNARIGGDSQAKHPMVVGKHCFYTETNNNGDSLASMWEELKFRPAQMRFRQPRGRLWTRTHSAGSVHQLDHILINSKWVNSLRNCRAYNSVELDSDHLILGITLSISLRTSRGKPCSQSKFNWNKFRDSAIRE